MLRAAGTIIGCLLRGYDAAVAAEPTTPEARGSLGESGGRDPFSDCPGGAARPLHDRRPPRSAPAILQPFVKIPLATRAADRGPEEQRAALRHSL